MLCCPTTGSSWLSQTACKPTWTWSWFKKQLFAGFYPRLPGGVVDARLHKTNPSGTFGMIDLPQLPHSANDLADIELIIPGVKDHILRIHPHTRGIPWNSCELDSIDPVTHSPQIGLRISQSYYGGPVVEHTVWPTRASGQPCGKIRTYAFSCFYYDGCNLVTAEVMLSHNYIFLDNHGIPTNGLTCLGERELHVHECPSVCVFPQGLACCMFDGRKWPPRIASISIQLIQQKLGTSYRRLGDCSIRSCNNSLQSLGFAKKLRISLGCLIQSE